MSRWLAVLLGFLAPFALVLAFAQPGLGALKGWDNFYLDTYPWNFAQKPKHLIIGTGCWTWTAEAYMQKGGHQQITTQRAALHAALNDILREQAPEEAQRFYAFGRPDVDFDRHLISIYQAVRQGDVKSLVYINNPGSLQAFTRPVNLPAALEVLNEIERGYPELAADAAIYRKALLASNGYAMAVADASPMTAWAKGVAKRYRGMVESLAVTPFPGQRDREQGEKLFKEVLANYDNQSTCTTPERGLMPYAQYWIGAGGDEVWQAWLRLAAGLAKAHDVPFVYYIPPHLNLSEERYQAEFQPHFAGRIQKVLAQFPNAHLVDQAVGHGLSPCDQVYDSERLFGTGYLFNYAGKLKQSRLLLGEMSRLGLLNAEANRFAAPTRRETQLPHLDFLPVVLSDAQTEPVREELIRWNEWKLSRPVGEATP
ncbi:MAG: hypothetical protein EPN26_00700 [Rhodospirillales bacterium]|nr:MAG: hypothetical protein EPN26_00700 [Rhodospirillales bacterium]